MVDDSIVLHRDDPDKDPLIGHVKVTREDWINVARHILVNEGISQVKILTISERLEVSRSSFYWYFESRKDLLAALLDEWASLNTATLVRHCQMDAKNIGVAMCNFFRCFIDPNLFDRGLDFAIREWSRRDENVRNRIDEADQSRLEAIVNMFKRYQYGKYEAECRARILYFMQLGYHALDVNETMEVRMSRLQGYLEGFTGREISPQDYESLIAFAQEKARA